MISLLLLAILASANAQTSKPGTGAVCFTGDSLLTLEDGITTKKFRDLMIGDVILGADRNGTISASPVLFLPHPDNDIKRSFDEIGLVNGMTVRMTRNHLLPLCDGTLHTARSLRTDDCVMTKDGKSKVTQFTKDVQASGIYTAVTENEFLMVNGVVASPFAHGHGVAHSLFDRDDVTNWCAKNSKLLPAAADEEVQRMLKSRRLQTYKEFHQKASRLHHESHAAIVSNEGCVELMEMLFQNYKDEGVGWGTNGFGYKNFATEQTSLSQRLSGFTKAD